LRELEAELTRVCNGIEAWEQHLQEATATRPAAVDVAALQPLVDRFEELLRADDFEAQQQLDVILTRLAGSDLAESFAELRSHIARYDFEGALRLLRAIRNTG